MLTAEPVALVVDASVVLKWVLAEPDSPLAQALAEAEEELLLPDFCLNEACNICWLQVRKRRWSPAEAREALALLRALVQQAMAEALDSVGPYWAEENAQLVGMNRPSYGGPGSHGVSVVASFPLPDQQCGRLGIDMISNMEKVQGRAACTDMKELEFAYHAMQLDPVFIGFNIGGMTMDGKMLNFGAACDKANKVPKLADDWKKYRFSRGMALASAAHRAKRK